MVASQTLADRANGDTDKLVSPLVPLLNHTSQVVQMRLANMLDNGVSFNLRRYLHSTLDEPLATLMTANHLAGVRRSHLTYEQTRPKGESAKLELSFFSSVMDYFRTRSIVDLGALQKKYKTLAFEVVNFADQNIKAEITKATTTLIKEGAHVREAKRVLADKFAEFGIRPASKSQFETIFRTQSQIAFASGKFSSERSDGVIYDALWGYKYVTSGDDRVRPSHAILDGATLPKGDKFWRRFYPPNGWNCRCQAIPLFDAAEIVQPATHLPDGVIVRPDTGFSWNAGHVFSALGA